jgi:hypothetical protein
MKPKDGHPHLPGLGLPHQSKSRCCSSIEDGRFGAQAIRESIELKDRTHAREAYTQPALQAGRVAMLLPDRSRSPHQKYRLTTAGRALLAAPTGNHT